MCLFPAVLMLVNPAVLMAVLMLVIVPVFMRMFVLMLVIVPMFMRMFMLMIVAVRMGQIDVLHGAFELLLCYLIGKALLFQSLCNDLVEKQGNGPCPSLT